MADKMEAAVRIWGQTMARIPRRRPHPARARCVPPNVWRRAQTDRVYLLGQEEGSKSLVGLSEPIDLAELTPSPAIAGETVVERQGRVLTPR